MARLATIAVLLACFWSAPVWARVCLEGTVRDQNAFDAFCQVYIAVKTEFGDHVGPRPTIKAIPARIAVDAENKMTSELLYEVSLEDSDASRAMVADEVGFSVRADRFKSLLKADLCRLSPGPKDLVDRGGLLIKVAIVLGKASAGTEKPQLKREILINITTCEAN